MSAAVASQVFSLVIADDQPFALSRAVGLLRRRNVKLRSVALGPGSADGSSHLQLVVQTDPADAERIAMLFEKVVGVRQATAIPAERAVQRSLALVRLRPPGPHMGELLDVLQLYRATLIDDSGEAVIAQIAGAEAFVQSCLRALEPYGIQEVAWTGCAALERGAASPVPTPVSHEVHA
jgi:acetolactate synthase I/III small subunit